MQNCLKFSTVLGVMSLKSSILIRPAGRSERGGVGGGNAVTMSVNTDSWSCSGERSFQSIHQRPSTGNSLPMEMSKKVTTLPLASASVTSGSAIVSRLAEGALLG